MEVSQLSSRPGPAGGGGAVVVPPFYITGGYTSTDGTTWTALTNKVSTVFSWKGAYNPSAGEYVFATNFRTAHYTNNNGSTWTTSDVGIDGSSRSVAYGAGKFVIVSDGGMRYSLDGKTNWTACTGTDVGASSCVYFSSFLQLFIVVTATKVLWSSNGIAFTTGTVTGTYGYATTSTSNQIYGNESTGLIVCTSNYSANYIYSTDGKTWTAKTAPFTSSCVYYSPTKGYWILGSTSGAGGISICTDPTASPPTWTTQSTSVTYIVSIWYSAYTGKFVIASFSGNNGISTSTDLVNFTLVRSAASDSYSSVVVSTVAD